EPLTFYMDGKPGKLSYWINILGGTYLYFANGLGSFLFCVYVDIKLYGYSSRIRRIYYKFGAVVACILLSLLINIWGGYYFYVDADKRTSAFNENAGRPYNIGFSIGHDKYDKENDDADSFFKKIDEAMYIDKARVHRERALTNDRRKT
ncbi:MAG: hypothetical protein IJ641_02590, partial [Lachnospiraceae bacterium]|nr:hypothetical protein [Lachnospiraceae bacterium]